ncbi:MAG: hypothetical protein ACOX9B_12400 [Candidatus Xenobium sp.]|jgi:hypothetical protein|nr:hypothetical protein [Burkholderiales bacterium]
MFSTGGFNNLNMMAGMPTTTGLPTGISPGFMAGPNGLNDVMKQLDQMFTQQMKLMNDLLKKLLGTSVNLNTGSGMFPCMDLSAQMASVMKMGKVTDQMISKMASMVTPEASLAALGGFGNGLGNVGTVSAASLGQGTAWGRSLASDALRHSVKGPGGWCYKYVAQALARHGVSVHGASAYMAADQLATKKEFREVKVSQADLKNLPAGAIVVWNKGNGHPHGHISISLGDGREVSDLVRNQITNYGTSYRVFLPNK